MNDNNDIKTILIERLKIKPVRYMSRQFLGDDLVSLIEKQTSFLESNHRLQERIYCIVNDICHHPVCPCCGKEVDRWHKFEDSVETYQNHYCSASCTRKHISYISNFTLNESIVISKEDLVAKLEEHYRTNKNYRIYDPVIISSTMHYLRMMNIDYCDFGLAQAYRFIMEGLTEIPKCPVCGKTVKYHSGCLEWKTYCSSKCSANSKITVEKRVVTNMKKYGVANVFQNKDVIQQMKQQKNTGTVINIDDETINVSDDTKNNVPEYLTEKSLKTVLETIYPGHEFIHDRIVPDSGMRNRADYYNSDLRLIVEFDGYRHYSCSKVIANDRFKDVAYLTMGYTVVRIPYFIQISPYVIKTLFGIDSDIVQTYPHGFIDDMALLPCDFCELGLARFGYDLHRFGKIYNEILSSLAKKVELSGDISTVLPPSLYHLLSNSSNYSLRSHSD